MGGHSAKWTSVLFQHELGVHQVHDKRPSLGLNIVYEFTIVSVSLELTIDTYHIDLCC